MLAEITPVLLTHNEAANIGRTLSRVAWAPDIVVVDSGSTDETLDMVRAFPQVRVFHRPFDDHANQWQFAMHETGIRTSWVLRLDADYIVPDALVDEIAELQADAPVSAYRVAFDYAIHARKLRASLYPPNVVLLRRGRFSIEDAGHTERWIASGAVKDLHARIMHDDRKPLSHWFASQRHYARREADYLLRGDPRALKRSDRVRRMAWPAPLAVFCYVLILKGCILDGWPGWYYALQRLFAETMIALELIDRRLRATAPDGDPAQADGGTQ